MTSRANDSIASLWVLLVVQTAIPSACSYGHGPPQIIAGRAFHEERIERVEVDALASEVRQLLGDPVEVQRTESTEVWRYFVHGVQHESVRLFGFLPLPGTTRSSWREVIVTLIDGRVVEVRVREEPTRSQ
jgi:hypothetical protein